MVLWLLNNSLLELISFLIRPTEAQFNLSRWYPKCQDFCQFYSWTDWIESYLIAVSERHVFSWRGSYYEYQYYPYSEMSMTDEKKTEPKHDKTNKMTCAPSEDSGQSRHPQCAQWVTKGTSSSCGQRRLWSDWADAQTDLSLRRAHRSFCTFVVLWLKYFYSLYIHVPRCHWNVFPCFSDEQKDYQTKLYEEAHI